jgi:hypothetical protein
MTAGLPVGSSPAAPGTLGGPRISLMPTLDSRKGDSEEELVPCWVSFSWPIAAKCQGVIQRPG